MAAVALEQTTVQQLNKLIEVVGKKSFNLVQGIKTSVAPKLNETIANTIDIRDEIVVINFIICILLDFLPF